MLHRLYLESVRWDADQAPSMLVFSDERDGGKLNIEIPEPIGFDLQTLLNQRIDGESPYCGTLELIRQLGAKVEKLIIQNCDRPGMASMLLDLGHKKVQVELFFADIVSIAIIEDMPIFFDTATYQKNELPLHKRILFTRTAHLTQYSFEAGG